VNEYSTDIPAIGADAPQAPALYDGGCRLLRWRHDAADGMTVDLQLTLPGVAGSHPFRGIPTGKETGQRMQVRVSLPSDRPGIALPVHEGEVLLLAWAESDRAGMMVRLLLDDGPDGEQGRHPFFGLAIGRRGEPLEMRAVAIAEDETVVGPSKIRERTPFHQKTEVQQSHILCREPRFQGFLLDNLDRLLRDEATRQALRGMADRPKDFADAAVRACLGVTTRSVMNQDGESAAKARLRWRKLLGLYEDAVFSRRRWTAPAEKDAAPAG